MEGKPITYNNFTVYPEYCKIGLEQLKAISVHDTNFIVASIKEDNYNTVYVLKFGKTIYSRDKYRLHPSEEVRRGQRKPEVTPYLNGNRVLILICYEILFPEDYLPLKDNPHLIIHLVGQPMFSEEQREGWMALQKTLSLIYNCSVICCCGGPRGRMNITGVTLKRESNEVKL